MGDSKMVMSGLEGPTAGGPCVPRVFVVGGPHRGGKQRARTTPGISHFRRVSPSSTFAMGAVDDLERHRVGFHWRAPPSGSPN